MVVTIDVRVREEAIARFLPAESAAMDARRFRAGDGSDSSVDAWTFTKEIIRKFGLGLSAHTIYNQVNSVLRERWPLRRSTTSRAYLGRDPLGNSKVPTARRRAA